MSDFGEPTHPVARKQHRCEMCFGPIPKGERHVQYKGKYDGEWQNWRAHEECYGGYDGEEQYGEFTPGEGEMPERVKALVLAQRAVKEQPK